jgi:hypothetical protein
MLNLNGYLLIGINVCLLKVDLLCNFYVNPSYGKKTYISFIDSAVN